MKNNITIKLTSINSAVLDKSVREVLNAVPEETYDYVVAEPLPVQVTEAGRMLVRRLSFVGTTNKFAAALAKVDVPHDVNISIR